AADDPSLLYHHAALHALRGQGEKAVELLRKTVEQEPDRIRSWLRNDRMFDSLRGDEAYDALLHGYRSFPRASRRQAQAALRPPLGRPAWLAPTPHRGQIHCSLARCGCRR